MNISTSSVTNLTDDTDLIRWDPKFLLGIPLIDEQHKHPVVIDTNVVLLALQSKFEINARR